MTNRQQKAASISAWTFDVEVCSVDSPPMHEVRVQFEALLIAPLLEPLAGPMGAYEADLFASEIAARLERER